MSIIVVPAEKKLGRPMRQVDLQREPLYRVERRIRGGKTFKKLDGVQNYVNEIVNSQWWENRFSSVERIVVTDGRGRQEGIAGILNYEDGQSKPIIGYIRLPRLARFQLYILHEIAHVCQPPKSAAHGIEFRRIYLQLVMRWMGREKANSLRKAFSKNGLKWRCVSPD